MPDAALCDHGFDGAVEGVGEHVAQRHLRAVRGEDEVCVEEDLVGLVEGEGQLVGVHELAVLFGPFAAHCGGVVREVD